MKATPLRPAPSRGPARSGSSQALLAAAIAAAVAAAIPAQAPPAAQFTTLRSLLLPLDSAATRALALGDVDADGDLDLVLGNAGQNRLLRNDGTGRFVDGTATGMPVTTDPTTALALGDVDADGDLDLVIGNNGQQNRLYLNDGTGAFTDASATRMPIDSDQTRVVALGDVDGDGDLDLVCGNTSGPVRLYGNDGTGNFTDLTAGRIPASGALTYTTSLALGDVDGDGDLDLLIGNTGYTGNRNLLYLNDGTGSFTDATAGHLPAPASFGGDLTFALALCDVDGDQDIDLVVGNAFQRTELFLNDGSGSFSEATTARMPVDSGEVTNALAFGDVDGDGDLDLVLGRGGYWTPGLRPNRLYLNDGAGRFADATSRLAVDADDTRSLAIGDVDGDGDVDIVVGNDGPNHLLVNLERQLDAPSALQVGQPYTLDVYSRFGPPSSFDVALPFLSLTRATIPVPPFGVLAVDPMETLPPVLIPRPAGVASVAWNVPNVPGAVGVELFAQALVVGWPSDARLTNLTTDVLLR